MSVLVIHNVTQTYRRPEGMVEALVDVSLSVSAGEFVAVQGPSGSGKTTLLLAAGGLLAPGSGTVEIDGQNPYALPADRRAGLRAEKVGFVFQQFHLVPYLSVMDNVLVPTLALSSPGAQERARELIERFGLSDRSQHRPGELSVGERQRTGLARALFNEPKLILADEPTGNLDEENARTVTESLEEYARNGGAVLLVTHDSDAAGFAQKRWRLDNGELSET